MPASAPARRPLRRLPDGSDDLDVRRRYLRQRRLSGDRGWITLWIAVSAVIGWLFIAGFSSLAH